MGKGMEKLTFRLPVSPSKRITFNVGGEVEVNPLDMARH